MTFTSDVEPIDTLAVRFTDWLVSEDCLATVAAPVELSMLGSHVRFPELHETAHSP
jgi:hypothetical protein